MAVAGKGAAAALVKPIFSRDLGEAKRRVRELYRAWYREVPNTGEGRAAAAHTLAGAPAQGRNGHPAVVLKGPSGVLVTLGGEESRRCPFPAACGTRGRGCLGPGSGCWVVGPPPACLPPLPEGLGRKPPSHSLLVIRFS